MTDYRYADNELEDAEEDNIFEIYEMMLDDDKYRWYEFSYNIFSEESRWDSEDSEWDIYERYG